MLSDGEGVLILEALCGHRQYFLRLLTCGNLRGAINCFYLNLNEAVASGLGDSRLLKCTIVVIVIIQVQCNPC